MPYPTRINPEDVILIARIMLEQGGADQFSLQKLARTLGVKAPSLYRYFAGKDDLLRAISFDTAQGMVRAMEEAAAACDNARDKLVAMALACRAFGHACPAAYRLAFTNSEAALRPDEAQMEALVLPIQEVMTQISGAAHSLAALRGLWALIHGFTLLELSGQFRRGGDLDADFVQAVEAYLDGRRT